MTMKFLILIILSISLSHASDSIFDTIASYNDNCSAYVRFGTDDVFFYPLGFKYDKVFLGIIESSDTVQIKDECSINLCRYSYSVLTPIIGNIPESKITLLGHCANDLLPNYVSVIGDSIVGKAPYTFFYYPISKETSVNGSDQPYDVTLWSEILPALNMKKFGDSNDILLYRLLHGYYRNKLDNFPKNYQEKRNILDEKWKFDDINFYENFTKQKNHWNFWAIVQFIETNKRKDYCDTRAYIYSSNVESDSAIQNFLIKGDCPRIKNFIVPTYILWNKEKGEIQIDSLLDPNDYIVTEKYIFDISFGKSFDSILDSILPQTFSADDVYKYSLKSTLKTQNEKMHFYTKKNLPDEYKSKIPEDSLNNVDRSYNKIQSWLKSLEDKK